MTELSVKTGLDVFLEDSSNIDKLKGKRLGLLCNPASVSKDLHHASGLILNKFSGQLKAFFSPQHGFFAEKQDNMIESDDFIETSNEIPVFSLYGKTRIPTEKMFSLIDALIIDLQDVGTRVYTFIYTMSYCMEAAKQYNKKIIVLDRPNPINGLDVEGNCLKKEFVSFVGRYPIPMRHGLTIGELALLFNEHFQIGCDLEVIKMSGWKRSMFFKDTGLSWILPSPNLPTPTSAIVYPGQVIWEGANISEGRGTTKPFEFFGAPFIEHDKLWKILKQAKLPGVFFRKISFEPTSNKWMNKICNGFCVHVTDKNKFKPYLTAITVLQAVLKLYKNEFKWKNPPYEYEYETLPIDLILGDKNIREKLQDFNNKPKDIEKSWQDKLNKFIKLSKKFYLYYL